MNLNHSQRLGLTLAAGIYAIGWILGYHAGQANSARALARDAIGALHAGPRRA